MLPSGEIGLYSVLNEGSTFTLCLPATYSGSGTATATFFKAGSVSTAPLVVRQAVKPEMIEDDRETLDPGDSVMLIGGR